MTRSGPKWEVSYPISLEECFLHEVTLPRTQSEEMWKKVLDLFQIQIFFSLKKTYLSCELITSPFQPKLIDTKVNLVCVREVSCCCPYTFPIPSFLLECSSLSMTLVLVIRYFALVQFQLVFSFLNTFLQYFIVLYRILLSQQSEDCLHLRHSNESIYLRKTSSQILSIACASVEDGPCILELLRFPSGTFTFCSASSYLAGFTSIAYV